MAVRYLRRQLQRQVPDAFPKLERVEVREVRRSLLADRFGDRALQGGPSAGFQGSL